MRMWKAGMLLAALFWAATAATVAAPEAPITTVTSVADAAMGGDVVTLRALLEQGADVNARFGDGMTGLHWAGSQGQRGDRGSFDRCRRRPRSDDTHWGAYTAPRRERRGPRFRGEGAPSGRCQRQRHNYHRSGRPLHFAAASGSALAVAALVEHEANVNAAEPQWGQTALMFAAAAGRTEVVEVLLEGEADPSIAAKVVDLVERNEHDRSERRERMKHIAELRSAKMKNAPKDGSEPREAEPEPEDRDEALRRGGEPVPLNYADLVATHGGLTPLLLAAREGHVGATLALIKGTADINQVSAADNTSPMLIAMLNGHFDVAMQLFELGADPNVASDAGATPLYAALNMHWAPKARHPQPVAYMQQELTYLEVMETLLTAGVNPNVRLKKTLWYTTYNRDLLGVNRAGATPFWRAAHALGHRSDAPFARPMARTRTCRRSKFPSDSPETETKWEAGTAQTTRACRRFPLGGPAVYPIHAAAGVGHGSRLRRQFASPRAGWMAPRREVSRGRARRRRERERLQGLQLSTPCRRPWETTSSSAISSQKVRM